MIYYLPTPQGARLQRSLRPIYEVNRGPYKLEGWHHVSGFEWHKGNPWIVLRYGDEKVVVRFDEEQIDYMADTWVPFDKR